MLLHTIQGPTSFADVRTVNGLICREACEQLGLLENDKHWEVTLNEALVTCFPAQLRNLFAIILTTCAPSKPKQLWETYKESLSEDILRQECRANPDIDLTYSSDIFNKCLILLEDKCVSMNGRTLQQLGLETPIRSGSEMIHIEILLETSYNLDVLRRVIETNEPILVHDQRLAYNAFLDTMEYGSGGLFFLDALAIQVN